MKIKSKLMLWDISRLMLSLLIVSINLREPFFHTREILYVMTITFSFIFMDLRKAKYVFFLLLIWVISVIYNLIVPGSNIDFGNGGFEPVIISAYLLLLCFYQERYAKVIIWSYVFVSIIVALIVVSIWLSCYISDSIFYNLRTFFVNIEDRTGLSLINIDKRMILGTRYLTVWYRTAPCMACTLGYYLSNRLEGKGKNTLLIFLLSIALIFTGTRANIISVFLLLGFYFGFTIYKRGLRLIPLITFLISMVVAIIFVIRFINDIDSQSSAIKVLDTMTYIDIYNEDPVRTVFFGWGAGSSFFSRGRQMYVNITEMSLLETIRRYGFISSCVIIFGIWFVPFRNLNYIRKKKHIRYFYSCIFGAYMLSALTNPYLLDSVGFCALLFFCTMFTYGIDT